MLEQALSNLKKVIDTAVARGGVFASGDEASAATTSLQIVEQVLKQREEALEKCQEQQKQSNEAVKEAPAE